MFNWQKMKNEKCIFLRSFWNVNFGFPVVQINSESFCLYFNTIGSRVEDIADHLTTAEWMV